MKVFVKTVAITLFSLIIIIRVNAFDSTFQIEQNNRINSGYNKHFIIDDNKFNIIISNTQGKTIHIFAYHDNQMFTRYQYPIRREDTVIFHPAGTLISNNNENNELTLYINEEMQHTSVSVDRRINEGDRAIIKVQGIADINNRFSGTLYLTIFIDYNNNGIIEQNEIENISIFINRSSNSVLFNTRAYISTMGYWLTNIQNPVYGRNFFYVRITNDYGKERFFELFGQDYYDNHPRDDRRIRGLDYTNYNMYVIFSPVTTEIELYNSPYHYSGDYKLIFDVKINRQSNRGRYVFARNYHVEKLNDRYELWINNNGRLIKLEEMKLY